MLNTLQLWSTRLKKPTAFSVFRLTKSDSTSFSFTPTFVSNTSSSLWAFSCKHEITSSLYLHLLYPSTSIVFFPLSDLFSPSTSIAFFLLPSLFSPLYQSCFLPSTSIVFPLYQHCFPSTSFIFFPLLKLFSSLYQHFLPSTSIVSFSLPALTSRVAPPP